MASPEVSAEIQLVSVNFVAADSINGGFPYAVLAYIAAATLAQRGIQTLVVTDNFANKVNIAALDEAEFPVPVGRYRFIVVGKEAFDLLPERTQQFVFDPPQPDKSDYFGAVGRECIQEGKSALNDTSDKLVEILNMIVFRAGDAYKERVRTFGSGD